MNEKEYKDAARKGQICSVSGRACKCESGEGCTRARGGSSLDEVADSSIRWARVSILRLTDAVEALDLAVDFLRYSRRAPAPEWRDKLRRMNALIRELEEEIGDYG